MDLDTHLTMEFATTTPTPILMRILGFCFGADDLSVRPPEQVKGPYYGLLTDSVLRMFHYFRDGDYDMRKLNEEIRYSYQQDEQFWWEMTGSSEAKQEDFEFGNQIAALTAWQEHYITGELPLPWVEQEEYHPVMMKLLIYKYIWLPLFPEETLPGYQPPASGYLPHFDRLLAESNSGKHDWIRRIKK